MRGLLPGKGWRACSFKCDESAFDLVQSRLSSFEFVEPASIRFNAGAVHFLVDLSRLPAGDGPSVALMLDFDLAQVVSRHRLPSDPPPKAA